MVETTAGIGKLCLEGCVAEVAFTRHLKHVERSDILIDCREETLNESGID
ncbi:hypothetical protein [Candidatus Sororendozoicomonas aggregata]